MIYVVAIWGIASIITTIVSLIVAPMRGRPGQVWAFWCFIFPPAVALLFVLPQHVGKPRGIR